MSKSLGERLAHALAVTQDQDVGDCPPDVMEIFEKAAPIFVASLSHDETATATIEGLRGEVEALKDALTFILPMAKGYASANRVGRNAEMIAEVEALLNPQEAHNAK